MTALLVTQEPGSIDLAALRGERRRRLFEAMADHGLDALLLGRPANVNFASGARQLWTAGARPPGPGCVVVAATGKVHLLSVWDEGVPAEIGHDQLFGLKWNPANLIPSIAAIPGLASARRVGADSYTPGFEQFLAAVAPGAEVADATAALLQARQPKSAEEVVLIEHAVAVAEAALTAMEEAVEPGARERDVLRAYLAAISRMGSPQPPTEGVVCATPRSGPVALRRIPSERLLGPAQLVALNPSALYAGYEGGLGRTVVVDHPTPAASRLAERCRAALDAVIDRCRAGARGADLRSADAEVLVFGLGMGAEPPVIGPTAGADAEVAPGMVLSVQAWVAEEGAGGVLLRDTVHVVDGTPRVLSRYRSALA
jgi:Xaa-Pro aminopeptidase